MKDARQVHVELEELLEQLRRELAPTRRQEAGWGTRLRAVALGGLVGGGLALLCAPQAGVVTRRRLRQRGGELQGRASELASQASEQASVDRVLRGRHAASTPPDTPRLLGGRVWGRS